jgi:hypothetical protein
LSLLAEISSKQLVLIDIYSVRRNHLLILSFSLLIGFVYSLFLLLVCSTTPGILSGFLLFGSQIAMGIPAARAYYDLGVSTRESLHFIDPAQLNDDHSLHKAEFNLGDISLVFEKMDLQISKYDKGTLDDLSDLAWFGILVWAAFSSTTYFLKLSSYPLCIVGTLVFLIAALMSYLSGYRTKRNIGFEDDLSQLEYYVDTRLKGIDAVLGPVGAKFFAELLKRRGKLILVDFGAAVNVDAETTLVYHLGFPSNESERISVSARTEILSSLQEHLLNSNILSVNGWNVEMIDTPAQSVLGVYNQLSSFSVCNRSSYVTDPSQVADSSKTTAAVVSEVAAQFM